MAIAYDHVQEEAFSPSEEDAQRTTAAETSTNLNADLQQAFQAGESFVSDLQKEAQEAQEQATQGWSNLREQVVQRTRGLSLGAEAGPEVRVPASAHQAEAEAFGGEKHGSLPADIVKEASTLVALLRPTAASRLKVLQKAEDAADEALLMFGSDIRNFLRDAVIISTPTDADISKPGGIGAAGYEVFFET
ncbi:hypothetical protein LTR82_017309 [Friedmanniomyces endolithicus]|uniref:Uncharacterized protein n=1 Tax=Friedmanniomyces endolithicus TaxID=329885 RepID=A0AAN6J0V7_9PEZI|nr:hypothetical protein LTR82_017309 [Friedmanniomyces endolithicus]